MNVSETLVCDNGCMVYAPFDVCTHKDTKRRVQWFLLALFIHIGQIFATESFPPQPLCFQTMILNGFSRHVRHLITTAFHPRASDHLPTNASTQPLHLSPLLRAPRAEPVPITCPPSLGKTTTLYLLHTHPTYTLDNTHPFSLAPSSHDKYFYILFIFYLSVLPLLQK